MNGFIRTTVGSSSFRIPFQTCNKNTVCCNRYLLALVGVVAESLSSATDNLGSTRPRFSQLTKQKNSFWIRRSSSSFSTSSTIASKTMNLKEVLCGLDHFAPASLAESWDNVGLLVEPTPPHQVNTIFLTNDLTEEVLAEAIDKTADFILSYHPPIFTALKRLTMASTKERIIVRAIEKRIAIYSPHTSYDAVAGGVNDWLAEGLGSCKVEPLRMSHMTSASDDGWTYKLEYLEASSTVLLPPDIGASTVTRVQTKTGTIQCTVNCNEQGLVSIMKIMEGLPEIKKSVQITKLEKPPIPGTGIGRLCKLENPVSIAMVVQLVKIHLKLQHVQLALGSEKSKESEVKSVAICAGSGASVLSGVPADVYLTGEMSHHDILAAVARGTSVIVCNHSNTERGYLHVLKSKLNVEFDGKVDVVVSEIDADPLTVV